MKVYTSYYGASRDSGIGTRAQSAELNDVLIKNTLVDLSAFRAISAQEKDNEALMYLLKKDGESILGLSYTEPPSSSGYNRAAPCGIQYVCDAGEMDYDQIGSIVNFAVFKKPDSELPAPLSMIPVNESGYIFHNSPAVLAQVIDALVKVALSENNETALIVLPQGRNSEYTSARYTISEALGYLPKDLRSKISFFTSLPVSGENYDALTAFDTAGKYGANVVFCSPDNYQKLKSRRSFIEANMDNPVKTGAFATLIARNKEPACFLKLTEQTVEGKLTYESLNAAAQRVEHGEVATLDQLQAQKKELSKQLSKTEKEKQSLQENLAKSRDEEDRLTSEIEKLKRTCQKLKSQVNENTKTESTKNESTKKESKRNLLKDKIFIISVVVAVIIGLVVGGILYSALFSGDKGNEVVDNKSESTLEQELTAEPEPTAELNQTVEPGQTSELEPTAEPEPSPKLESTADSQQGLEEPVNEPESTDKQELPNDTESADGPELPAEPDQTNEPEQNVEQELGGEPEPTEDSQPESEELVNEQDPFSEQELPTDLESTEESAQSAEPELTSEPELIAEPESTDGPDEESEQLSRTAPIVIDTDLPALIIYTDFDKEHFETEFGSDFDVREYSEEALSAEETNNAIVVLLIGEKELVDRPESDAQDNGIILYSYIYNEEQGKYTISRDGSVVDNFGEELRKLAGQQLPADSSEGKD